MFDLFTPKSRKQTPRAHTSPLPFAIITRRRGRPAGSTADSTNRINTLLSGSSRHSSETLAALPKDGRGHGRSRGRAHAAEPNLVLPASRRALRSLTPASQLRMVLNVLQVLYFNTLIFAIWV